MAVSRLKFPTYFNMKDASGPGLSSMANFTNTATGTYTDASGASYKYVTFTAGSSTLIIDNPGYADVLLLGAGGGGGAAWYGGGGGSGGFIEQSFTFVNGSYNVVVGAAGVGGVPTNSMTSGGNSTLSTLTALGGGRGGSYIASPSPFRIGADGGSGGGGNALQTGAGGTGYGDQGFGGGTGHATTAGAGGGGGSAVGGNASSMVGGVGGAGRSTLMIGGSATLVCAGGGGGTENGTLGQGGVGGGGNGGNRTIAPGTGQNATSFGSGGGGAGGPDVTSGNGSPGLCVVRVRIS